MNISLMAEEVTKQIIKELKSAKYFSIIVDSSTDISHTDQLAVIVRYVLENGHPVERFLCFVPNAGHKSIKLFDAVVTVLVGFDIDIANCRGQSYDNAMNISGKYAGLQARINEISPNAVYSPCSAHSLNLVGEHAASCCKESNDFFLLLQNLYVFFSSSTYRWEILQRHLTQRENRTLKGLSQTRWSARYDACQSLNKDWNEVIEALTSIAEDETEISCTRCEASGILRQLQHLETAILSSVRDNLLQRFYFSSKKLQAANIDLYTVAELYGSLINYVESIRSTN